MNRANGSSWLSPNGVQRREQILLLARQEARHKRRRREVICTVAANVVFVVISLITAMVARMQMSEPSYNVPQSQVATNPPPSVTDSLVPTSTMQVSYIQTDRTILDRVSIQSELPGWQSIDDDELIRTLAEAGQQVGIIQFDGKTELMTR